MLEVENLKKRFKGVVAVADVSFRVNAGEAVALLGPNGAGKTTTASMICGLLRPDSGRVLFGGRQARGDADRHKRFLGLVPQELALVEELSARANLRFFGALQGLRGTAMKTAIDRGLDLVGLSPRADVPVRAYSGGMKRRLNLIATLLHNPRLIVLDEPTVGVDPQSRNAIFEVLEGVKAEGRAILYTTHYMEEAERLCDRAVIIDSGRVVADGPISQLSEAVSQVTRLVIRLDSTDTRPCIERVKPIAGVISAEGEPGRLVVGLSDIRIVPRILDELNEAGVGVRGFATEHRDLQSAFLELTGRGTRDS
jgi:ABC-2 type transport system ATP-binding protein